jgi:hypothetical protein
MLTKIYLSLLTLSISAMGFFTLYSWSWLSSIGSPAGAVVGYEYHASASWPVLWLSASILLILANSILWVTGRLWPMWTTLLYFQMFVLIRAFWLDPALLNFKNAAGFADSTFTVAPILAAFLIIIAAAIVFFDQFLILRMKEKTYRAMDESEADIGDSSPFEDKNPRSD